jgi:hypothetical protein
VGVWTGRRVSRVCGCVGGREGAVGRGFGCRQLDKGNVMSQQRCVSA